VYTDARARARVHTGYIRYSPQAAGYCNHADVSRASQAGARERERERERNAAAGVQGLTRNQGVSRTRQFICSRSIIPPKSDEQPLVYSLAQVTASGWSAELGGERGFVAANSLYISLSLSLGSSVPPLTLIFALALVRTVRCRVLD